MDNFDPQLMARVRAFHAKHGRPLRVLHIGNIANNAFHNAMLLHRMGIECDVLCHDYYHIMGCPEWEEADFDNRLGDHYRPDWFTQDLNGYQRPLWFVQGPLFLAMDYLQARAEGDFLKAKRLWRKLGVLNRTRAPDWVEFVTGFATTIASWTRRGYNVWTHATRLRELLEDRAQPHRNPGGVWGARTVRLLAPLLLAGAAGWRALEPLRARLLPASAADRREKVRAYARAAWLCERFHAAFPTRTDQLTAADISSWLWALRRWRTLLERYDIVQGFATSAIVPMVAGRPYFAFEHGTLREIPFRATAEGRLTALAYHLAEHVFVTNADCLPNARLLADDRVTAINHPYDEDAGFPISGWEVLRAELCTELDADFLLFHPTRQDWVPGTGYADKGNDIVFRALAALRARGLRVGMVCCLWGANVNESQRLLTELRLERYVRWVAPLANVRFVRMARACGLVVDQFLLGGFGGVTFKSLAAGVPVCTNLDEAAALNSIGAMPPVLKCADETKLTSLIADLYCDPARLAALSSISRAWIKQHHSGREVVEIQLGRYLDSVERAGR